MKSLSILMALTGFAVLASTVAVESEPT